MYHLYAAGVVIAGGLFFTYTTCCRRKTGPHKTPYFSPSVNTNPHNYQRKFSTSLKSEVDPLYYSLLTALTFLDTEERLKSTGILREVGVVSTVQGLHAFMSKNVTLAPLTTLTDTEILTVNNVIGALKMAIKETFSTQYFNGQILFKSLQAAENSAKATVYQQHVQNLINQGKEKEACILHNLFYLYSRISHYQQFNLMSAANIAKISTPAFSTLFGVPTPTTLTLSTYTKNQGEITQLLENLITSNCFAQPFHDCIQATSQPGVKP